MVVSNQLRQSVQGQRRINAALNNLPVYELPDQKVQLGWTLEHALRNQGVHEGGYEHLALEVLMTEAFPEGYAAKVLHTMAIEYAGPEDIIPHFHQLLNQVRSSNGLFTSTDLPTIVEAYAALDPFNRVLKGGSKTLQVPSPKAFSSALCLLGKVTSDHTKQMTIIGGPVVAWFAAASEWLYDLKVAIYTSSGERLHSNHDGDTEPSQLLLIYNAYPGIIPQLGSWTNDSEQAKHIAAGSPHADTASLSSTTFGGRLTYSNLLVRVFGSSFRHLDREESKTFGTAIGTCARILEGMAEAENANPTTIRRRSPSTYGQGLLTTLSNFLPELRHLQGRMERQLKLTPDEAGVRYGEQIEALKALCGCATCIPKPHSPPEDDKKPGLEGYCLPSLTETIVALGILLAGIMVAPAIFPTRFGIQQFYLAQANKRLRATLSNTSGPQLFQDLYFDVPDAQRLVQVAEIFSGSQPSKGLRDNLVALSHEGICVWLVRQMDGLAGQDRDDLGLIDVTSGGICVRQKIYRRACIGEPSVEEGKEFEDVWEEVQVNCLPKGESLWCK